MKRREFVTLLGAAAAWPMPVRGQQSQPVRLMGVLTPNIQSDQEPRAWLRAFEERLQMLGWEQGRNLRIEYRWGGNNPQRLQSGAAELLAMGCEILFAMAAPAAAALTRETRTLPIVFVQVSDPVKLGFVASLARPGGNVTGFTNFEHPIGGKWLELLRDAAPGRNRLAVILEADNPLQNPYWEAIDAAASSFPVQITRADVRNAADIERSIDVFAQQPSGALIVAPNPVTIQHRDLIIALAARHRLPAVYPYRLFAKIGDLMSYGVDLPELYRQAAGYVDRILKGAKPADLPVQLASKFELVVNLNTAKALGLSIPEPFLLYADEVIE